DNVIYYETRETCSFDPDILSNMPEALRGTLLTVDEVVATPLEKKSLKEQYGAVAVDMETYALAEDARTRHLPFVSVRCITDTADQELIDCSHLVAEDGDVSKLKAGWHILTHPGDLKGMIDLGKNAKQATANLTVYVSQWIQE
ncbi:MAG: hypothetical protein OEZ51_13665, partial [Nitrospinota bacterium]|nr:hypothetical protein [Nitrospinota bacterium]